MPSGGRGACNSKRPTAEVGATMSWHDELMATCWRGQCPGLGSAGRVRGRGRNWAFTLGVVKTGTSETRMRVWNVEGPGRAMSPDWRWLSTTVASLATVTGWILERFKHCGHWRGDSQSTANNSSQGRTSFQRYCALIVDENVFDKNKTRDNNSAADDRQYNKMSTSTFTIMWPRIIELWRFSTDVKHHAVPLRHVCSVLIYVQRITGFTTMRYINLRFTYLLTYLYTYLLYWLREVV